MKQFYVYIAASKTGTLYTGVTNDLRRRMYEHKNKLIPGFTQRYGVDKLVYCEASQSITAAIMREKQIKGWRRSKKVDLIETENPKWSNLSDKLLL